MDREASDEENPVLGRLLKCSLPAVVALLAMPAGAQDVRPLEPVWRVVSQEGTPARSGPDSVYYTVAELSAGTVLRADGETDSFIRVRYPAGLTLMVPEDEVRSAASGANGERRVELVEASGLRAPSELLGMSGSWMTVYEPALSAGTILRVAGEVRNEAGDLVGYRVHPVSSEASGVHARMFVASSALREATPEEVERHLSAGRGAAEPVTQNPVQQPEQQPVQRPAATPAEPNETGTGDAGAGNSDSEPVQATSPENGDGGEQPAGQAPVELSQGGRETPRVRDAMLPAGLEALEASFEAARKQPAEEVDQALDELLAEFQRTRASTDDADRLAWQLDQRIEWLKLRIETRDQRRAIRAALAEADERAQALQEQADAWQKTRSYQLVGRLVASSVYNGERLPRMYRVQAINTLDGTPRTLGYLQPGEGVDSKVGKVVGIIGRARFDPQLRLMVIRPERVDVMPE